MHPRLISATEGTLPPTPTRAHARNDAGPQIPARLSRTPTRHQRGRHPRLRLLVPTTLSRQKTKPVVRQNESAFPPVRGPAPETDTSPGETPLGRGGLPQASPLRQGVGVSARWRETRAGSDSVARAPAGAMLGQPLQLLGVLA